MYIFADCLDPADNSHPNPTWMSTSVNCSWLVKHILTLYIKQIIAALHATRKINLLETKITRLSLLNRTKQTVRRISISIINEMQMCRFYGINFLLKYERFSLALTWISRLVTTVTVWSKSGGGGWNIWHRWWQPLPHPTFSKWMQLLQYNILSCYVCNKLQTL
jgi:hypothetical protein